MYHPIGIAVNFGYITPPEVRLNSIFPEEMANPKCFVYGTIVRQDKKITELEMQSKRKKYPALDVDEHAHCGEGRPLLILFENRDALLHNRKLTDWTSELDAERSGETNEEIRMIFSRRRVAAWKKQDIYPKVHATATTGNGLFLKRGRK